jgi:hypothetical protein
MNKKTMNDAQFQIFLKEVKSELKTDAWLREHGIVPQQLQQLAMEVLQAQKIAKNLLTKHGGLMTQEQVDFVQKFYRSSRSTLKRSKPTKRACLQVMDIGAAVNRKKFKLDRQQKRKG